jgi:aminoglycoside phosphotransferase (APT) family kinase protein
MPQSTDAPIDWAVVRSWMTDRGLVDGDLTDIEPIGGGTQNLMFSFRSGPHCFVLRRGPEHLRQHTNDALRREARVLTALADTDVPAPRVIGAEPDESVLGSVFYLMEPVDGFNASVGLPEPHASDPEMQNAMGFHAVDALVALGAVDPAGVGLADLGRPDGFLERQVPQWLAKLDEYAGLDGYAGHRLPNVGATAAWLEQQRPDSFRPGIMHGDFHLANLMFRSDGPQVAAIVDWEMCTLGDPLLDLGWLLATWPRGSVATGHYAMAATLPTRAELVAYYRKTAERDVEHVQWYAVMASFKLGIVLEGTHARACAGKAPKPVGDLLHGIAVGLLTQATDFIEKGL